MNVGILIAIIKNNVYNNIVIQRTHKLEVTKNRHHGVMPVFCYFNEIHQK